jgi:hypothetical protein
MLHRHPISGNGHSITSHPRPEVSARPLMRGSKLSSVDSGFRPARGSVVAGLKACSYIASGSSENFSCTMSLRSKPRSVKA